MLGRSHFNLFNKDTRELFMLCMLCFVPVIIRYLFIIIRYLYICACYFHYHSFILFIVRLFHPRCCSILFLFDSFVSSFIVHCSKEKTSIQILDCVPGIMIRHTTSSMRVNKHHTADCTNFVLV